MKLNQFTRITSRTVYLVPYRPYHVEKYHKWMEDEELRRLTASERLSLEDEYKMQRTWLNDENKCTFIVLDRETMDETGDEIGAMIGDANLYLDDKGQTAEIGLMVAEARYRGRGMGKEITLSLLRYAIDHLCIRKLNAIISHDNEPCVRLFKRLSFVKESESAVFKEITFGKDVDSDFVDFINRNTVEYKEDVHDQ